MKKPVRIPESAGIAHRQPGSEPKVGSAMDESASSEEFSPPTTRDRLAHRFLQTRHAPGSVPVAGAAALAGTTRSRLEQGFRAGSGDESLGARRAAAQEPGTGGAPANRGGPLQLRKESAAGDGPPSRGGAATSWGTIAHLATQLRAGSGAGAASPESAADASRTADAHGVADAGMADSSRPLPFGDRIQKSFGGHDISGVRAHLGPRATAANDALGALAYARGDRVAFAGQPGLYTAAHEAAHVVQQRSGEVRLRDGVGRVGDRYEREADAVAERVTRGESAEHLLHPYGGRSGGGAPAVQMIMGARAKARPAEEWAEDQALKKTEREKRTADFKRMTALIERLREGDPVKVAARDVWSAWIDQGGLDLLHVPEFVMPSEVRPWLEKLGPDALDRLKSLTGGINKLGDQIDDIKKSRAGNSFPATGGGKVGTREDKKEEKLGGREKTWSKNEEERRDASANQWRRLVERRQIADQRRAFEQQQIKERADSKNPEALKEQQDSKRARFEKLMENREKAIEGKYQQRENQRYERYRKTRDEHDPTKSPEEREAARQKRLEKEKTDKAEQAAKKKEKVGTGKKITKAATDNIKKNVANPEVNAFSWEEKRKASLSKTEETHVSEGGIRRDYTNELGAVEAGAAAKAGWTPKDGVKVSGSAGASVALVKGGWKFTFPPKHIDMGGESLIADITAGIDWGALIDVKGSVELNVGPGEHGGYEVGAQAGVEAFAGAKLALSGGIGVQWVKKPWTEYKKLIKGNIPWLLSAPFGNASDVMQRVIAQVMESRPKLVDSLMDRWLPDLLGSAGHASVVAAQVSGAVTAGIGAAAKARASFNGSTLQVNASAGATFGVGFKGDVGVTIGLFDALRLIYVMMMRNRLKPILPEAQGKIWEWLREAGKGMLPLFVAQLHLLPREDKARIRSMMPIRSGDIADLLLGPKT